MQKSCWGSHGGVASKDDSECRSSHWQHPKTAHAHVHAKSWQFTILASPKRKYYKFEQLFKLKNVKKSKKGLKTIAQTFRHFFRDE